jgi:hypothetical protein
MLVHHAVVSALSAVHPLVRPRAADISNAPVIPTTCVPTAVVPIVAPASEHRSWAAFSASKVKAQRWLIMLRLCVKGANQASCLGAGTCLGWPEVTRDRTIIVRLVGIFSIFCVYPPLHTVFVCTVYVLDM